MADQEPLLPHANGSEHASSSTSTSAAARRKQRLGRAIESRRFHKFVLTLVSFMLDLSSYTCPYAAAVAITTFDLPDCWGPALMTDYH